MQTTSQTTKFNPAQITILKLLERPINEQEVEEIKDLLVDFFDKKLQKQVMQDIEEKQIAETDFDALRKGVKVKMILKKRTFGIAKGMIELSPDFDKPLDDLKDYM